MSRQIKQQIKPPTPTRPGTITLDYKHGIIDMRVRYAHSWQQITCPVIKIWKRESFDTVCKEVGEQVLSMLNLFEDSKKDE